MDTLPGFRDFYPEDCARRDALFELWRETSRVHGFVEMDAPMLEPVDLYRKKSGDELVGQLFDFVDKGGRHVALRPELTPSLARMIVSRARDFRKPIKWFSIAPFFRYEKQQRGRTREFWQFNADLVGEPGVAGDAEVITLAIRLLESLGLGREDVAVRVSDRRAWSVHLAARGLDAAAAAEVLQVVDKWEREDPEKLRLRLQPHGVEPAEIEEFLRTPPEKIPAFAELLDLMDGHGLADYLSFDLGVVRGLAYYTGFVFEVFAKQQKARAIAGGGRYDDLLARMSDGAVDLPAAGFGMGDVVIGDLVADTPAAKAVVDVAAARRSSLDLYVVIDDETRRREALELVRRCRQAGWRTDYPLAPAKFGRQAQAAEAAGARYAIIVDAAWPQVRLRTLATREDVTHDACTARGASGAGSGPLIPDLS